MKYHIVHQVYYFISPNKSNVSIYFRSTISAHISENSVDILIFIFPICILKPELYFNQHIPILLPQLRLSPNSYTMKVKHLADSHLHRLNAQQSKSSPTGTCQATCHRLKKLSAPHSHPICKVQRLRNKCINKWQQGVVDRQ